MTTLTLIRRAYLPTGTYGTLYMPEGEAIWTIECPWKDNIPSVSCIPEGLYSLTKDTFKDKYPNYKVANPPPGRYAIEIHRANWVHELKGCIGVGLKLNRDLSLLASEEAMDWLMEVLEDYTDVLLHITQYRPNMGQ